MHPPSILWISNVFISLPLSRRWFSIQNSQLVYQKKLKASPLQSMSAFFRDDVACESLVVLFMVIYIELRMISRSESKKHKIKTALSVLA